MAILTLVFVGAANPFRSPVGTTTTLLHYSTPQPLHSNEPWYIPNNKQAWELSEADESAINPAALVFGCVRTCKWRFIQLFNYWPQICTAYTIGNLLALFSLFSIETWSHYCMLYIGAYFDDFIVAFSSWKSKHLMNLALQQANNIFNYI